jgi:hypothetical protein
MKTEPTRLRDILAAGHPDNALVGVTIGMLKSWVALNPAAADLAATPYVGTVQSAAA